MAGTPKCWYCDSEFGEPEVIWNQLKPDYPENWKPLYAAPVDATAEIARLRGALEVLETDAHFIFNNPPGETSQDVRDVIEWFAGSIRVALEQAK